MSYFLQFNPQMIALLIIFFYILNSSLPLFGFYLNSIAFATANIPTIREQKIRQNLYCVGILIPEYTIRLTRCICLILFPITYFYFVGCILFKTEFDTCKTDNKNVD